MPSNPVNCTDHCMQFQFIPGDNPQLIQGHSSDFSDSVYHLLLYYFKILYLPLIADI